MHGSPMFKFPSYLVRLMTKGDHWWRSMTITPIPYVEVEIQTRLEQDVYRIHANLLMRFSLLPA
jgi:hypothetical protein